MRDIFEFKNNFSAYRDVVSVLKIGNKDLIPNPKVSIVMPVCSHPDYFELALKTAINQDYNGEYEIVIVDNDDSLGITKNQVVVEKNYTTNLLYYKNATNIGMFGNWNRCIELARAPYIVFLHDDDLLLTNALSTLMYIQKSTGDKAIFTAFHTINAEGEFINKASAVSSKFGIFKCKSVFRYSLFDQFLHSAGFGCGCLFCKQKMLEIGGYDPEFYPSADYALQACYTYKYGSVYCTIPTFKYREAENESLKVYQQFAEVDRHFRSCMKKHLVMPKFVLDRIIKANYNISKIRFLIRWGKQDPSLVKKIKWSDKVVMRIANMIANMKHYEIKKF